MLNSLKNISLVSLLVIFSSFIQAIEYTIPLKYGKHKVGYSEASTKSFIWQPCECKGRKLTLADMDISQLLKGLKAPNQNISRVSLRAELIEQPIYSDKPIIIVPGGYLKSAFNITAEFFASHGYQVLYIMPEQHELLSFFKQVNAELSQVDRLWRQNKNIYFLGFHSGSGAAMSLSNRIPGKGIISIEGNEAWKNSKYGWPKLTRLLKVEQMKLPIHRFYTANPEPEWYFSSPKNTTMDFVDTYFGRIEQTLLSNKYDHDATSDLALWYGWQPILNTYSKINHVKEYQNMLNNILAQLKKWQ